MYEKIYVVEVTSAKYDVYVSQLLYTTRTMAEIAAKEIYDAFDKKHVENGWKRKRYNYTYHNDQNQIYRYSNYFTRDYKLTPSDNENADIAITILEYTLNQGIDKILNQFPKIV